MKHRNELTVALAILVAGVGLSKAPAAAAVLPAANGGVTCLSPSGFVTDPKSCSTANDYGSLSYGPVAQVNGYAFGEGLTDAANFFGYLNYSLEVVGGKPGDVVPLDIAVILKAMPISIGYAFSELGVAADGSVTETICSSTCGVGTGVTNFNGILHVNAVSGTVYTNAVHLEVEAGGALGPASDFDGATVSADPHIYVDPSFTDASDYSILLSPGVGNSLPGGVPEPKSWALMLLGFAGLGVLMRSRRRIATVAA